MNSILSELQKNRILLLDGAMGTMIQKSHLREEDYRGYRFRNYSGQMSGNNDILSLTCPDVIRNIHRSYLEAGADIITTNTFNAQRISQKEYHCESYIEEINREGLRIAIEEAHTFNTKEKPRFVIGTVGPTNKMLSMSPDVENPAYRAISFDELYEAYFEQIRVLLQGGADGILLETIFDTLNAKAGILAYEAARKEIGTEAALMLSMTISDKAGRTLSGQTVDAFLTSVSHAPILSVGLNCSFGASDILPYLRVLSRKAPFYVSVHPNAGLPNQFGEYEQTPQQMANEMKTFINEKLVNIIGGCCGTTPEYTQEMAQLIETSSSDKSLFRQPVQVCHKVTLSGLESLESEGERFINVGERCNVAGSRKFLRLINEGSYEEALSIARQQVEDGAMVLDINMDDGLLDAKKEMVNFLQLIASDPNISKVPIMIDSSNWDVILAGLKCVQGKGIVNSISLKEGEEIFLYHARQIKELGAAVVVMAFDEEGQATTYERRISVCQRAYNLLVNNVGIKPEDIIFDPNILAVATGIPEHDSYAYDFIRSVAWIRQHLPGVHVSGGISNLSFSFRGHNLLREAMHAVFLYHARLAGMDFAILNPASKVMYDDISEELVHTIEQVYLHPSSLASEELIQWASRDIEVENHPQAETSHNTLDISVEERLMECLRKGSTENLQDTLDEAITKYQNPVDIIEGPLMDGMKRVGMLFGEGKMFLPQVVKTARTMKQAVSVLEPLIRKQKADGYSSMGNVLLATVKGDVHDIGKNIVGVVMACNGYEVIDMGVMVPAEEIVKKALETHPCLIGLSGLITPSLTEMEHVLVLLRENGISVPVMIGGATTSALHTALRLAPLYEGPVLWMKDASQNVPATAPYLNPSTRDEAFKALKAEQQSLIGESHVANIRTLEEARNRKCQLF